MHPLAARRPLIAPVSDACCGLTEPPMGVVGGGGGVAVTGADQGDRGCLIVEEARSLQMFSGQSIQLSCTSSAFSPGFAVTAATWWVRLDCTLPGETSVSAPCASASAPGTPAGGPCCRRRQDRCVEVLPVGPDVPPAQMGGQPLQRMDRTWAGHQRVGGKSLSGTAAPHHPERHDAAAGQHAVAAAAGRRPRPTVTG